MKTDNSIQPLTTAELSSLEQLIPSHIDINQIPIPSWQYNSLDSNSNLGLYNTHNPIPPTISIAPNTTGISSIAIGTTIGGSAGLYNSTQSAQGAFDFDSINEQRVEKIVKKNLKPIQDRLAILETPDQRVLEKFESLKMAYDHYRMLEALMHTEIQKVKEEK